MQLLLCQQAFKEEEFMADHERTTISDGSPMSAHIRKKRHRKQWVKARERGVANGEALIFASELPPKVQTSKGGRNVQANARKRAKRLEQAQSNNNN
jgi:hypothetical protein